MKNEEPRYFAPNHILEKYLFEFYCNPKDYIIIDDKIHRTYETLAKKWLMQQEYEKAEACIKKALSYNCIDMDVNELYISLLQQQGRWKELIDTAMDFYPFCYTRKDMALFYRTIGSYAIANYQPELARAVYTYSNVMYQSQKADAELAYINSAIGERTAQYTEKELSDIMRQNSLPELPRQETLELVYRTAMSEQDNNSEYADTLLLFLKQFTQI